MRFTLKKYLDLHAEQVFDLQKQKDENQKMNLYKCGQVFYKTGKRTCTAID